MDLIASVLSYIAAISLAFICGKAYCELNMEEEINELRSNNFTLVAKNETLTSKIASIDEYINNMNGDCK